MVAEIRLRLGTNIIFTIIVVSYLAVKYFCNSGYDMYICNQDPPLTDIRLLKFYRAPIYVEYVVLEMMAFHNYCFSDVATVQYSSPKITVLWKDNENIVPCLH